MAFLPPHFLKLCFLRCKYSLGPFIARLALQISRRASHWQPLLKRGAKTQTGWVR